jgi:hypothetical protein
VEPGRGLEEVGHQAVTFTGGLLAVCDHEGDAELPRMVVSDERDAAQLDRPGREAFASPARGAGCDHRTARHQEAHR